MAKVVIEEVGTPFVALDDGGMEYEIHSMAKVAYYHTSEEDRRNVASAQLHTADARVVGYRSKGHYHIAADGVELHSDDLNAP
jgi:hypothetical protein